MSTFIDTSAWFASSIPSDPRHLDVKAWFRSNVLPLITTDYVIDETLTLLRAKGYSSRAVSLGHDIFEQNVVRVHFVHAAEILSAWELFRDQPTRRWSFTDCTSKVVMDRFHIRRALALDEHFREFGFELLP